MLTKSKKVRKSFRLVFGDLSGSMNVLEMSAWKNFASKLS